MSYPMTRINAVDTILSEVSQTQKDRHCIVLVTHGVTGAKNTAVASSARESIGEGGGATPEHNVLEATCMPRL